MPCYYTVIQYVPDPVSDERINIGVLVFDENAMHSRFLRNWQRVGVFGASDISFLKDFAKEVAGRTAISSTLPKLERISEENIRKIAGSWMNSIQFTEPRASILGTQEVMTQIVPLVLKQPTLKSRYRDRRTASAKAYEHLEISLKSMVGARWEKYLYRNLVLDGVIDKHIFDVGVRNGKVVGAALGLSFEGPAGKDLRKEVDAACWTVADTRDKNRALKISIITLPPKSHSKTYDNARYVFSRLNADVVEESELSDWAHDVAQAARASDKRAQGSSARVHRKKTQPKSPKRVGSAPRRSR
jgi:hypothetical protein